MDQNHSSLSRPLSAFKKVKLKEAIPVRLRSGHERIRGITFMSGDWRESRFRVRLYRFMAESIPLINSVIWTWSRLAAAPGAFGFFKGDHPIENMAAASVLDRLFNRVIRANFGHNGAQDDLLHPLFQSLFLDGAVVGKMELYKDLSGVANFRFFDLGRSEIIFSPSGELTVIESDDKGEHRYSGSDIFFYALNADLANPYGRSILKAIPFVSYVEQQLVDDMRRTMHNAGYHRLHIKITPPERRDGEGDDAYVDRANSYFDNTVSMIRDIEPEDNPITWDDVSIEYLGPKNFGGTRVSNWYVNHRAMVEEICTGTNLAPFLLGYSYNTTTNWAQLKYDLVMRQVRSVQNAAITFLDWLAGIELALKGFNLISRWRFDNDFSALAKEQGEINGREAAYVIDLYNAGLIDKESAARKAARLI